jgi:hypothetical protein
MRGQNRTFQSNLTGGELSPAMYSRTDVVKYQTGVKEATNVIIKPEGGMRSVPGTVFVGEVRDSAKRGFLLPFDLGVGETYVLEFGDNTIRFIRDGAYILDSTTEKTITGATAANPAVFTAAAHGFSNGQRVWIDQIDPDENLSLNNRFFTVAGATTDTFTLLDEWGVAVSLNDPLTTGRATRDYVLTTPYDVDLIERVNFAQDQATMYLLSREYPVQRLTRIDPDSWTIEPETFQPSISPPTGVRARDTDYQFITVTGVSTANPAVVTAAAHGLATGQEFTFTTADANGQDLLGTVYTVTVINANSFSLNGVDRTALSAVASAVGNRVYDDATDVYAYKVSVISDETGEESLPSDAVYTGNDLAIVDQKNVISWDAVTGAARYVIYKEDNGIFGFIGGTTALSFEDENITADLADTPQQGRNPFDGVGNYPGCGTFFEQRLTLASTKNNPAGVWASQSANPRNFGVSSPVKASDAITFRVRANRVTTIEALVPTERLLMLTRSGEWLVRGSSQEEFLTPTNVVLRQRAFRGSTAVPPVVAGDFVVHIQRGGRAVRDLNFERDVVSTDLTILARHLIPPGVSVVRAVYQQEPYSAIWVITSDGRLLALTYMLEHDIWGWTRMEFDGFVEDAAVVEEDDSDALYIQVRRTINGQTKRYIERMLNNEPTTSLDAYCVRCGAWAEFETPVDTIYGLSHLEGEPVVALVDGNVIRDLTVEDGRVVLPVEGTVVAIGREYRARIRTLDIDLGVVRGLGSMLERQKSATSVILRAENSRGIFVGHGTEELVEFRQRASENYDEAIALFTGSFEVTPYTDWTEGGDIIIEQRDPLPMTIAGILIDWEFGE